MTTGLVYGSGAEDEGMVRWLKLELANVRPSGLSNQRLPSKGHIIR